MKAIAGGQANIDFSKVEIKATDLGNKTYMLEGAGGNITVAVGTDGIIMVDAQWAPLHDKIKAAIQKISPLLVKYVINTHYHGDHTDGNAAFHREGATIVGQDNIRLRLVAGSTNGLTGSRSQPAPADAVPRPISAAARMSPSAAASQKCVIAPMPTRTATAGFISATPT